MSFSTLQVDSEAMAVLKMNNGPLPKSSRDITDVPPEHREVRTDSATGQSYLARVKHGRTEWFILKESPRITTVLAVQEAVQPVLSEATTVEDVKKPEEPPTKKSAAVPKKVV